MIAAAFILGVPALIVLVCWVFGWETPDGP